MLGPAIGKLPSSPPPGPSRASRAPRAKTSKRTLRGSRLSLRQRPDSLFILVIVLLILPIKRIFLVAVRSRLVALIRRRLLGECRSSRGRSSDGHLLNLVVDWRGRGALLEDRFGCHASSGVEPTGRGGRKKQRLENSSLHLFQLGPPQSPSVFATPPASARWTQADSWLLLRNKHMFTLRLIPSPSPPVSSFPTEASPFHSCFRSQMCSSPNQTRSQASKRSSSA